MDEITTMTKEQVYEEISINQRQLLFEYERGPEPCVKINNDDEVRIWNYKRILGWGQVVDVPFNSWTTKEAGFSRFGRYALLMKGKEAYLFCLGILPYLVGTPKWIYCKRCIDKYENR